VVQYELSKIRYIGLEKAKAIEIYESVGDWPNTFFLYI
jgi:hypothetical protein